MTSRKMINTLYDEAINYTDRGSYISDLALSSIWGDDPSADIPADRIDMLGRIWDTAHLTVKEIRSYTGLSQAKFGQRFHIPTSTIENWERGTRTPPPYVVYLLALATGLEKEFD